MQTQSSRAVIDDRMAAWQRDRLNDLARGIKRIRAIRWAEADDDEFAGLSEVLHAAWAQEAYWQTAVANDCAPWFEVRQ